MRTIRVSVPNILKPFQFKQVVRCCFEPGWNLSSAASSNCGSAPLSEDKISGIREATILGRYSFCFRYALAALTATADITLLDAGHFETPRPTTLEVLPQRRRFSQDAPRQSDGEIAQAEPLLPSRGRQMLVEQFNGLIANVLRECVVRGLHGRISLGSLAHRRKNVDGVERSRVSRPTG